MINWYENPEELRRVRKKLGLTQAQLAAKAGVKRSLIANIEAGRRRFTKDMQDLIWEPLAEIEVTRRMRPLIPPEQWAKWGGVIPPEQWAKWGEKTSLKDIGRPRS